MGKKKRRDARVARENEVAVPHELTRSQRVDLVRAFSQDLADRYGVAVDFAVREAHREGDERNFHAHILPTMRAWGENGPRTRRQGSARLGLERRGIETEQIRHEAQARWLAYREGRAPQGSGGAHATAVQDTGLDRSEAAKQTPRPARIHLLDHDQGL